MTRYWNEDLHMSLYVDIKKSFGNFKLDIRFEADHEILALLGASGCGKSMTLKCIAGIEKPDEGKIVLDGITLFDSFKRVNLPPQKRKTGLLFQSYALFPNMTVEQNICVGMRATGRTSSNSRQTAALVETFRLSGLESLYPSQLSGGQQQRVALARIFASEPRLIMLDEPFSALDSYLRWQLGTEVGAILRSFGGTTLFVSHHRNEVFRLCNRIAVVSDGTIQVIADPWDLYHNPRYYSASVLTGCKNISKVDQHNGDTIWATDWGITLSVLGKSTDVIHYIGVREEELEPCYDLDSVNSFEYETKNIYHDASGYVLTIQLKKSTALPLIWKLCNQAFDELKKYPNYVRIPPDKIQLLIYCSHLGNPAKSRPSSQAL